MDKKEFVQRYVISYASHMYGHKKPTYDLVMKAKQVWNEIERELKGSQDG